jgi:hypothetical protein
MLMQQWPQQPHTFLLSSKLAYNGQDGRPVVNSAGRVCNHFQRCCAVFALCLRGWRYKRLDGSTNRIQRMIDIQQFNRPGGPRVLFFIGAWHTCTWNADM